MRLTLRGTGTAVLGLLMLGVGLWWRYPGMAAFGLALTALVLASVVTVLVASPLSVSRTVRPRTVPRLARCSGRLELSVTGRWPVALDAVDVVAGVPSVVEVPLLAPGVVEAVDYAIPTERRGVFDVGPLTLRRQGLAGLAQARTVLGEVVQVRVVPRVLPVRGLPAGARRGQVGADERVERGGTDLVGLREYVPGDDLRRLHWATSARTGTLMIREDADPARPHLAVLLDDNSASYAVEQRFEEAVEVAASLVTSALEQGHPVRLLTSSGGTDIDQAQDAAPILSALADLRLRDGDGRRTVPVRDLDVVAVISGTAVPALVLEAGRAAFGVVLVVDEQRPVGTAGSVLVLSGASAEDLVGSWNAVVAR
ncbi:Uncharacterized conserved protein, DUF58 family, contains vWF domain [Lentzea xinjiangensis]|uniref:Uncharacterized conserved protein, DUF58 family, contains vWF domain n=1 Tax=Lentzea xinjiangensis TaxID=402600 RepID=A0A1H9WPD6_9PSEU|nr:DUF58 domain-containing protein [Lentzea xinjiangensis]SES35768.1 Uncharacterized conserved protein, DUF58 family, contains vWF domain [Lentzea xinjiangensis]